MRTTLNRIVAIAALTVLGLGVSLAAAQQSSHSTAVQQRHKDIAKVMVENKMTLAKAIEAAEQYTKGLALTAVTRVQGKDILVDVMCLSSDVIRNVTVDVKTGQVTDTVMPHKAATPSSTHKKTGTTTGKKPAKKP